MGIDVKLLGFLLSLVAAVSCCSNYNTYCQSWASRGYCSSNAAYMRQYCPKACGLCRRVRPVQPAQQPSGSCYDSGQYCQDWAAKGECSKNPNYMRVSCRKSCRICSTRPAPKAVPKPTWSSWESWGSCSKTCGGGKQYRSRTCSKGGCSGSKTQSQTCNSQTCPQWASWGSWESCSTTCGIGSRQRFRKCPVYNCPGSNVEAQTCNAGSCPTWSNWGPWGVCTVTCGTGIRIRDRTCSSGSCPGQKSETQYCNTDLCPKPVVPKPGPPSPGPSVGQCGTVGAPDIPIAKGRVVGGIDSFEGAWPWQVGIHESEFSKYPFCGGTLIGPNIVLTAAHCFHMPRNPKVRVGDHDLGKKGKEEKVISVNNIYPHMKYNRETMENDIAILLLDEPVKLSAKVNTACMPQADDEATNCYVTGWGRILEGGPQSVVLQQASMPLIDKSTCNQAMNGKILPGMLCSGHKDKKIDACQGDSGGPLVCVRKKDGRFVLKGVTSWGFGCARKGLYGVYTDVEKFKDWIKNTLASN